MSLVECLLPTSVTTVCIESGLDTSSTIKEQREDLAQDGVPGEDCLLFWSSTCDVIQSYSLSSTRLNGELYGISRSLGREKSYTTALSAQLQSFCYLYMAVFIARNPSIDSNLAVCIAPSSLFASNQFFTESVWSCIRLQCPESGLSKLQALHWTQPSCMYSFKSFRFLSVSCLHSTKSLLLLTRLATQLPVLLLH